MTESSQLATTKPRVVEDFATVESQLEKELPGCGSVRRLLPVAARLTTPERRCPRC